jgi:hypothetical protein
VERWFSDHLAPKRKILVQALSDACCLRAVNVIKSAFHGLGCHLSPCMLLKLRFFVDSIPSALTNLPAFPKLL